MTYQEQYDIFDWLFSSIDELIDCNYLTNTMEDKNDELRRKGLASLSEQSKRDKRSNAEMLKRKTALHGERTRQGRGKEKCY